MNKGQDAFIWFVLGNISFANTNMCAFVPSIECFVCIRVV